MALSEAQLAWLTLDLTDGMGPKRIWAALRSLQAPESIFTMSLTELEKLGLPGNSAQAVASGTSRRRAEEESMRVTEAGGQVLTPSDAIYPRRLLEIYDPPPVLRCLGELSLLNRPGLAIIGTRHPTPYGSGMAQLLARELGSRGLVILSGMARGVDAAAHIGALDAKAKTVAVWGTGIDVIYPKENKKLAERILAEGGAIVSEFAMGTFPAPQNFPIRNRVLSGMSVGVLVVEAGENSGTRITSRCALEQNRDVFAVPGNVTNKQSWTPNTLIKQGAKLVATWEDVWEDLPSDVKHAVDNLTGGDIAVESCEGGEASVVAARPVPPDQSAVYELLQKDEAMQLDEVIEALEPGLSSPEIFAALFELELAGRVRQMPGKNYVKCF
jgi:DNA processing protein